jgi:gliding motility-associated-like protein
MLMCRHLLLILLLLVISNISLAQLCQGSLGDPIVNINFGSGLNPGPPLAAATTNYQYVPDDCPNDGFYTLRNTTASCFGSTWYTINADHTGNAGGYFMLVNASFLPSAFYVDTVSGLCTNSTYEFAAWVMNVIKPSACGGNPIMPDLTFRIEKLDGTLLQSFNSGSIPATAMPVWRQYGFFFSTPPGVSEVILRIINNAPGGCGNDLALDDITFRPCGPLINGSIAGETNDTVTFCNGAASKNYTFNCFVSAGFNNPSFQWQQNNGSGWTDIAGATTNSYTASFASNTSPGVYQYRLTAAETGNIGNTVCRVASDALVVLVATTPVTTITANNPVCENNHLLMTASGGTQYLWSGENGFSATGSNVSISNIQSLQAGTYYVEVSNASGCKHLDSIIINVRPGALANTATALVNICKGDSISLQGSGTGTYQWLPSTGLSSSVISNPKASPANTTNYSFIVTNSFNCRDTAYTKVNVIALPKADAGPDRICFGGRPVILLANASGDNISYSWSPAQYMDDASALRPIVNPPTEINYVMKVVSLDGCGISTDTVTVFVDKQISVPSAFTPDKNGMNDRWRTPVLSSFASYEVSVYDRFGKELYHVQNDNSGWDGRYQGKDMPQGTYVYFIRIYDLGTTLKGSFVLLRR